MTRPTSTRSIMARTTPFCRLNRSKVIMSILNIERGIGMICFVVQGIQETKRENGWLADFLGPRQPFVRIGKLGLGLLSPVRVISNSGTAQRDLPSGNGDVGWLRCGDMEDPLLRLIGFIVSLRQGSLLTLVRRDQHLNRTSDAY